jgi:hypothetical protein
MSSISNALRQGPFQTTPPESSKRTSEEDLSQLAHAWSAHTPRPARP